MVSVIINKQLTRLGYSLHHLRENNSFDLTMLEGTCILTGSNAILLGDSISGIATLTDSDKSVLFSNVDSVGDWFQGNITEQDCYQMYRSKLAYANHTVFFCSLIDLLLNKSSGAQELDRNDKQDQFKTATLLLTGGNYKFEIIIGTDASALVTNLSTEETMKIDNSAAIKGLLSYVRRLESVTMQAKSPKGVRSVTIEGNLPYIFKELVFYLNKTIVAEYLQEDGSIKKLYIFDKHIVEVAEPSGNTSAILTYSINKLPEEYPANIYLEAVTYKDLIQRIEDNLRSQNYIPIKVRR